MKKNLHSVGMRTVVGYGAMVLSCVMYAWSLNLFLAPNAIVTGGISGLAVMANYVNNNIQIGSLTVLLNLPILVLAIKFLGWKFVVKCLITLLCLGIVTDVFPDMPSITSDPLLASIYGGVCQGIGIGLFVKYGFSSGGTELLARLISQWTKVIKIPVCLGILDGIVVLIGTIVTKNINNMLYALIVIFVSTKISETMLMGLEKSKCCIIITDMGKEISDALIHRLPRGVTMLDGEGMYTSRPHNVVLTCVKNRQLVQLKQIIAEIDPSAFIIINDAVEVRGRGFQSLSSK